MQQKISMKKLLIILLILLVIGCTENNILSRKDAEKIAEEKVYQVTSDKHLFAEGEPYARASVYEEERESWIVIAYGYHSYFEVIVKNDGSAKVLLTVEKKYKEMFSDLFKI